MPLDPDLLLNRRFPRIEHRYCARDAILYALGIGLGRDALDPMDLRFLIGSEMDVLPTMAVTLATPGLWVKDKALGIDWVRLVHIAQAATFHAPLPSEADVFADAHVLSVADRGSEKGAVVTLQRSIYHSTDGALLCTVIQTLLLRGDGGFGGVLPRRTPDDPLPDRQPDIVTSFVTSPRAALIYRLSGDLNPLHVNPSVAAAAGFERPILHGLASYGIAGWVVLCAFCKGCASALASLALRFVGVVMPGDTIDFRLWRDGDRVLFRAYVGGRLTLDNGVAVLRTVGGNHE